MRILHVTRIFCRSINSIVAERASFGAFFCEYLGEIWLRFNGTASDHDALTDLFLKEDDLQ